VGPCRRGCPLPDLSGRKNDEREVGGPVAG
jgi:hypothetical protein